jgi:hypothetical protein
MADNFNELTKQFNEQTMKQVRDVLSSLDNVSQLQSYNQDGMGNFPYWYTTGPSQSFNELTYTWIDQVVKYTKENGALTNAANQMVGQLSTFIYNNLSFALSSEDNTKLQETTTRTAAEANALVTTYTQNVGPIPSDQTNNLDYVTGQILTWGPADKPITLVELKNSFNLSKALPNMPASGSAVLPALTIWLNASSSTLSLQNSESAGNALIDYLQQSVIDPNSATSIKTLDPTNPNAAPKLQPKWVINKAANAILNDLKNEGNKIALSIESSKSSSTTTNLSVNGGAGISAGLSWLSFGVSGSASYNVSTANTSAAKATVEISYPGVNAVPAQPMTAARTGNSAEGWMSQTALTQANKNGTNLPPQESGFIFSPALPSSTDLDVDGNFGYINTTVISGQPTIKITYESGDSSIYKSVFEQNSDWSVKLLGIFTVSKASQSYYKAEVEESTSGSGFTVTISPSVEEFTVPDAQKRANVLAAAVTWPGDAS